MDEKLIKTHDLPNGLTLNIYDGSKKIADKGEFQSEHASTAQRKLEGDIWLVSLTLRMETPVLDSYFAQDGSSALTREKVVQVLGETVLFEKTMARNLVHSSEKDEIFEQVLKEAEKSMIPYLSHPEFGKKFVHKVYADETSPAAMHRKGLL
ncbi:hypothetical protein SAMN02745216_04647 [Desulfatibacillum alkenivorans DSM 16219]|jgi:hypothetical protein|uniref:Uncharacterized protein n=1 Tax=Desulfatibacillum alkenivorans DSM 16219 TaxID=1121393 RepID=A0A1M6Y0V6_9BACT|nr:hypothetical protein [Desulfatibacillum alkenivorans]SHL11837.1 hypothetical protein SAMN02745216_04647 [Desulfatibacillum alkenivorans DSM 16219]